jgi:hypothetical protein
MRNSQGFRPRFRIGFHPGPHQIRTEEEEGRDDDDLRYGQAEVVDRISSGAIAELLRQRAMLIDSMDVSKLSNVEKFKLMEDTREMMIQLYGGNPTKFATEKVIYAILTFSGAVIIVLALLTSFAGLSSQVTTTFVGTVVGGTIATIAQKLGKVGR